MYPAPRRFLRLCFALLMLAAACVPVTATLTAPSAVPPTAALSSPSPTSAPSATASALKSPTPASTAAVISTPTTPAPADTPTSAPTQPNTATSAPAAGVFPPAPASLRQVVGGLEKPVYLTQPDDGSGRFFVVEQAGQIVILRNGQLLPTPFLDLTDRVTSRGSEQGLLGLAFHPQYRTNGRFFVYYTNVQGNIVIARYTVSAGNPDVADPQSAFTLLQIDHPNFQNHNGGSLVFGPDGYLYIGVGDGGSAGDPHRNGQNLNTLLAKVLRIDVNAEPYAIPADNPFNGQADKRPEIWAYGLRNPWRFSFDRATGDLYIADVGQNSYEEVDYQAAGSPAGVNYGWSLMEGLHPYSGTQSPGLTLPVTEYSHTEGGCSITGGYVYRGTQWPQWAGQYFFGDYCTGLIWALGQTSGGWQRALVLQSGLSISSFGEDLAGEIYVLDHQGGAVYQLVVAP